MTEHRSIVAAAFKGQCAGGTVNLDDADNAEEEEHHPDDAIALNLYF